MNQALKNKKALILETAREINAPKWTPAEIEQLRLRLIADHGEAGKTGPEYIADVLKDAGHVVAARDAADADGAQVDAFAGSVLAEDAGGHDGGKAKHGDSAGGRLEEFAA